MRTRKSRRLATAGVALSILTVTGGAALATHHTWVRHDGGNLCEPDVLGGAVGTQFEQLVRKEGTFNSSNGMAMITCPVNMAGVFGSSTGSHKIHAQTAALQMEIHVFDGHTTEQLGCAVVATTSTGAESFSERKFSCATVGGCLTPVAAFTGWNRLAFAESRNLAGRRLGVDHAETFDDVRSLAFICDVPAVQSGRQSGVAGVKTSICKRDNKNGACYDVSENP